jgi:radical SAM protein with 4Fe4S-binding SPASM domain
VVVQEYSLPAGSFSRMYLGKDGIPRAIAYHTPSQSVALIEGDSAEVWTRLFEDKGRTDSASSYVLEHGCFHENPREEARRVVEDFARSLVDVNLLTTRAPQSETVDDRELIEPSTIGEAADARKNVELQISNFVAANRILYGLTVELTYRCNERCIHCYCPENRCTDELTTAQFFSLLDEFQSGGGLVLTLTGGEVFFRRDIKTILHGLVDRNVVVNVISNLTMADEESLDILAEIHPRSVGCSIYSAVPEVHDRITGVLHSWERSVGALRALKVRGVPILLKTPLMRNTVKGAESVKALADDLACDVQFDLNITPRNDGGRGPIDLRVKETAAIRELFALPYYRIYRDDEPFAIADEGDAASAMLCGAGATGLVVGPDGSIRPCMGLMKPLGQWPGSSLRDVWETSPFFPEWSGYRLTDIEKCSKCAVRPFCNRCPGAWELETGSAKRPSDYTCFVAEVWSGCQVRR